MSEAQLRKRIVVFPKGSPRVVPKARPKKRAADAKASPISMPMTSVAKTEQRRPVGSACSGCVHSITVCSKDREEDIVIVTVGMGTAEAGQVMYRKESKHVVSNVANHHH